MLDDKSGEWLADARKRFGLSQPELARRLGVSRQAVNAWERGKKRISPKRWPLILTVLQDLTTEHEELRQRIAKLLEAWDIH